MSQREKLVNQILSGRHDKNIVFDELCALLQYFGFQMRIKGSHHIFCKDEIEEILNLQPKDGKAKPYQVKQVREVILNYRLGGDTDV